MMSQVPSFTQKIIIFAFCLSASSVFCLSIAPQPPHPLNIKYKQSKAVITARIINIIRDETELEATKKIITSYNEKLQKEIISLNQKTDEIRYPVKRSTTKRSINNNLKEIRQIHSKILKLRKRLTTGKFVYSSNYTRVSNLHEKLQERLLLLVSELKKGQKTLNKIESTKIELSSNKIKKINILKEKVKYKKKHIENNNITNHYNGSIKIEMEILKKHKENKTYSDMMITNIAEIIEFTKGHRKGLLQSPTEKLIYKSYKRNSNLSWDFLYKLNQNSYITLFYDKNKNITHKLFHENQDVARNTMMRLESGSYRESDHFLIGKVQTIFNKPKITSNNNSRLNIRHFPKVSKERIKNPGRNEKQNKPRSRISILH